VSVRSDVAASYAAARSDAALLQAALRVEEVGVLAYAAAAQALQGEARAMAQRFADHEHQHAAALETMLQALTVPVRRHAGAEDLETLLPGLAGGSPGTVLRGLAELEQAAMDGHQVLARRLVALDALRTVAMITCGSAQHLVALRNMTGS
jgi:rubrerythrin